MHSSVDGTRSYTFYSVEEFYSHSLWSPAGVSHLVDLKGFKVSPYFFGPQAVEIVYTNISPAHGVSADPLAD
jgi:hypothetical protein